MPFDGLTIHRLCCELNQLLVGARLDKIYQPEKDELLFSIRQPGSGTFKLLLSANARWSRLQITEKKSNNPMSPPAFCMLLRKYLEGGKIKRIYQVDFDRIIHIEIEALNEFREWRSKLLICEFMGKHSNIILVNPEQQTIIDAIKKYGSDLSSFREVLPGKPYLRPPTQGKLDPTGTPFDQFAQAMYQMGDQSTLAGALFRVFSGMSPFSCRELCTGAGLDKEMALDHCGEYELRVLYQHVQAFLQILDEDNIRPEAVYVNNHPQEFAPFPIFSWCEGKKLYFNSINEACQRFFDDRLNIARLDSMKANISRHIKDIMDRCYRKKFHQEGDLAQALENKRYQVWGELITAYAHELVKGQTQARLENFYDGDVIEIDLDPRFNPIQNAQRYFKIYNKSTKAIKHLDGLMTANQQEIDYLESVMLAIQQAESLDQLEEIVEELEKEHYLKEKARRRRSTPHRSEPRRYLSSDGLEILVGRNNRQNDSLTLRQAEGGDLWLHAKDVPGTHVIVKLPAAARSIFDVPDTTIEEAASLAALFSKAAESDKVAVDYTFRSNVKKPGGARPGMVIYDNYWTIMVNPRSMNLILL